MSPRDRSCVWLGIVLMVCGMSVGCTPGSLGMLLYPWSDDKVQPACKLAPEKRNKEVTVAIVCNFSRPETRLDLLLADQNLAERLANLLTKNFKDNKQKVTIIPPAKVRTAQSKLKGIATDQEIGETLKADFVINLDINLLELTDRRAPELYRGRAEISVRTLDMNKIKGERQIFEKDYHKTYPIDSDVREVSEFSANQFRAEFLDRIAQDLSRFFCAYPSNLRFDMN